MSGDLGGGWFARLPNGVTVRALASPSELRVSYSRTYTKEGMHLIERDIQGLEVSRQKIASAVYDDTWVLFGGVDIDGLDTMVGAKWPEVAEGVSRHLLGLMSCGWGTTPDEPLDWFGSPEELSFMVEGSYRVREGAPVLSGMGGARIDVHSCGPEGFEATPHGTSNRFELKGDPALQCALLGLEPVR